MEATMPQSNPQAEIQNILTDISSTVQNAPKHKMNKKNVWLVTVFVLIAAALILYAVINKSTTQGLSEAEKMQILDYLESETTPVTTTIEEKQDVVKILQERAMQQ